MSTAVGSGNRAAGLSRDADDPAGQEVEAVRSIRDAIEGRVREPVAGLLPA